MLKKLNVIFKKIAVNIAFYISKQLIKLKEYKKAEIFLLKIHNKDNSNKKILKHLNFARKYYAFEAGDKKNNIDLNKIFETVFKDSNLKISSKTLSKMNGTTYYVRLHKVIKNNSTVSVIEKIADYDYNCKNELFLFNQILKDTDIFAPKVLYHEIKDDLLYIFYEYINGTQADFSNIEHLKQIAVSAALTANIKFKDEYLSYSNSGKNNQDISIFSAKIKDQTILSKINSIIENKEKFFNQYFSFPLVLNHNDLASINIIINKEKHAYFIDWSGWSFAPAGSCLGKVFIHSPYSLDFFIKNIIPVFHQNLKSNIFIEDIVRSFAYSSFYVSLKYLFKNKKSRQNLIKKLLESSDYLIKNF